MDALAILDIFMMSLSAVPCICGNIMVIISVIKFKYLQTRTNLFVTALAISDLTMGLIAVPSTLAVRNIDSITLSNSSYQIWHRSCIAGNFFQHASALGDLLSISAITVDRFLYINYPLKYPIIMTKRYVDQVYMI